jgi:hypothetical protein
MCMIYRCISNYSFKLNTLMPCEFSLVVWPVMSIFVVTWGDTPSVKAMGGQIWSSESFASNLWRNWHKKRKLDSNFWFHNGVYWLYGACKQTQRMLTYSDVCWSMLTCMRTNSTFADVFWRLLKYADVCWHVLAFADVCWRMLTYSDVCWRMLTYSDVCWRMLKYSDACWRMLTYAWTFEHNEFATWNGAGANSTNPTIRVHSSRIALLSSDPIVWNDVWSPCSFDPSIFQTIHARWQVEERSFWSSSKN